MHHAPCRMCHASCCPMCHVYSIVCTSSFMIYHLSFSIIDFNDFITFHFFISRSSFLFIINNFNLSFIHFLFSSITRFYLSVFVSISSYFLFPYCFSNYPVVICYDWLLNIFCSEFRLLLLQYSLSIIDFSNFIGYSHQSLPLFSARKPHRTCYQSLRRLWSTCPDPPRRILPLLLVVRVTHESHGSHKPMTPECYWKHWEMAWLNKDSESDQRQARIAPGPLPDATSLKVEWSCFEHLSYFSFIATFYLNLWYFTLLSLQLVPAMCPGDHLYPRTALKKRTWKQTGHHRLSPTAVVLSHLSTKCRSCLGCGASFLECSKLLSTHKC